METRKNYYKSPLYYPDDKDILDFLASSHVGDKKIRNILSRRGILLPKSLTLEELMSRLSRQILSWQDLVELVELVDLGVTKENTAYSTLGKEIEITELLAAVDRVKDVRQGPQKESYSIETIGTKTVLRVDYIDIDSSKSPMLQGRPATLVLEFENQSGESQITHTSNERSKNILESIVKELRSRAEPDDTAKLALKGVSLKNILDAKRRVQFFRELSRGVNGFTYEKATSVKVSRLNATGPKKETDPQEEEILRGAILQGINVEESTHYKNLLSAGFFISSLTWDAQKNDSQEFVSFTAGFKKPEEGEGFEFKINYKYSVNEKGQVEKSTLPPATATNLKNALCKAAVSAVSRISEEAESEDAGPAPID